MFFNGELKLNEAICTLLIHWRKTSKTVISGRCLNLTEMYVIMNKPKQTICGT